MLSNLLIVMALSTSVPSIETHNTCKQVSDLVGSIAELRDNGVSRTEALDHIYKMDVQEDVRQAGVQFTNIVYDSTMLSAKVMSDTAYTGCVKP